MTEKVSSSSFYGQRNWTSEEGKWVAQGHAVQLTKSGLVCSSFFYVTVTFKRTVHSPSGCEPESLVAPRELGECARWGEESLNEFKTICFVLQSLSSDLGLHFHHSALGWMFLCRGEPEQGYVLVLGRWGLRRLGYPWRGSSGLLTLWGQPHPSLMLGLSLYEGCSQRTQ